MNPASKEMSGQQTLQKKVPKPELGNQCVVDS